MPRSVRALFVPLLLVLLAACAPKTTVPTLYQYAVFDSFAGGAYTEHIVFNLFLCASRCPESEFAIHHIGMAGIESHVLGEFAHLAWTIHLSVEFVRSGLSIFSHCSFHNRSGSAMATSFGMYAEDL